MLVQLADSGYDECTDTPWLSAGKNAEPHHKIIRKAEAVPQTWAKGDAAIYCCQHDSMYTLRLPAISTAD